MRSISKTVFKAINLEIDFLTSNKIKCLTKMSFRIWHTVITLIAKTIKKTQSLGFFL